MVRISCTVGSRHAAVILMLENFNCCLSLEVTLPDMYHAGKTAKPGSIRALHRIHSASWRSDNWSPDILGLQEGTPALLDALTPKIRALPGSSARGFELGC